MTIPLETQAVLGLLIPAGYEPVKYNPVKENHLVFDMSIRQYRQPYTGELGRKIRHFLSVIRESR